MRIAIAGAGNVGRSVARELLHHGHQVLLIEKERRRFDPHSVPAADWLMGDACELSTLEEAGAQTCDVLIAATGDDKSNLVVGLLAKTEFGVARVVARINEVANEWLFSSSWGIDVAVSAPGALVAGVEGAIDVGHLVRLMGFREGQAELTKLTLPDDNPLVGARVGMLRLPENTALVTLLRGSEVILPAPDHVLEAGDEMVFVADSTVEQSVRDAIGGAQLLRAPSTGVSELE
ncbi:potassium transporter TrkA [Mycobacterium sp. MS1601]|uniref:potassium channel family protein n=1 Tax=Mycobacterium sp. MS1601 TaxID=1936029 RepID=UPI0009793085|nr:TrkA family potassium uptake protein [Mycobacterium sp. MS1601]AQA06389.1 potassium transporter TrkA [Mycobacterium sp. MS1601]